MTKAIIFDLDGTLIQTEVLKATSYAKAINSLTNNTIEEQHVLDIFQKFVGLSRTEVVEGLYTTFSTALQTHLGIKDPELGQKLLINKRLEIYRTILDDADLLSHHFCSKTLGLFNTLYSDGFKLVLATMSHLPEAKKVLTIMGILNKFDLILTRDDVQKGKPNPEIYLKATHLLNLPPEQCLIIEDSVNGIKAAINAKIPVFAITNSVTRQSVNSSNLLDKEYVINDLTALKSTIYNHIQQK